MELGLDEFASWLYFGTHRQRNRDVLEVDLEPPSQGVAYATLVAQSCRVSSAPECSAATTISSGNETVWVLPSRTTGMGVGWSPRRRRVSVVFDLGKGG